MGEWGKGEEWGRQTDVRQRLSNLVWLEPRCCESKKRKKKKKLVELLLVLVIYHGVTVTQNLVPHPTRGFCDLSSFPGVMSPGEAWLGIYGSRSILRWFSDVRPGLEHVLQGPHSHGC